MSQIVKGTEERGYRARSDRRIFSGRVIHIDAANPLMILDPQMYDALGNPRYMENVPYDAHTPYQINDIVLLEYQNVSPHSIAINAGSIGGANATSTVLGPYVHSIAKSGSPQLQDDVTFTGSAGIILNQVGQNIDISGSGVLPPATAIGSILMSLDGTTFQEVMSVTDPDNGWLVDSDGHLIVTPL